MKRVSFQEFFDLVEPINIYYPKGPHPKPDTSSGKFFPERLKEIQDFCDLNPEFHIASSAGDFTFWNKYMPNGRHYYLCYGDNDPEIICVFGSKADKILAFDLFERMIGE